MTVALAFALTRYYATVAHSLQCWSLYALFGRISALYDRKGFDDPSLISRSTGRDEFDDKP